MFTAKAWRKLGRRTTPVYVSVGRVTDGVSVLIESEGIVKDFAEISHTCADVSDAQLFVLRFTKNQNLAEWVALALPEAVSA